MLIYHKQQNNNNNLQENYCPRNKKSKQNNSDKNIIKITDFPKLCKFSLNLKLSRESTTSNKTVIINTAVDPVPTDNKIGLSIVNEK